MVARATSPPNPDTEIITATTVTAANSGDADPAEDLLATDLRQPADEDQGNGGEDTDGDGRGEPGGGECGGVAGVVNEPHDAAADADTESVAAQQWPSTAMLPTGRGRC